MQAQGHMCSQVQGRLLILAEHGGAALARDAGLLDSGIGKPLHLES